MPFATVYMQRITCQTLKTICALLLAWKQRPPQANVIRSLQTVQHFVHDHNRISLWITRFMKWDSRWSSSHFYWVSQIWILIIAVPSILQQTTFVSVNIYMAGGSGLHRSLERCFWKEDIHKCIWLKLICSKWNALLPPLCSWIQN